MKSTIIGIGSKNNMDPEFLVWDEFFARIVWKIKPMKDGDILLDGKAVYEELSKEFNLSKK